MFGGINPSQMKAMMKQMGIKQEEISTEKVIIEKSDGNKIIIENPNVQKIVMQGQESFQISGNSREESGEVGFDKDDVKMIMEKTGKSEKEVKKVLEETKDIAETIIRLS